MDGSLRTDLFPVITSSSQATAGNTCAGYQYDFKNYYIPRLEEPTVTRICSMENDLPRLQNFAHLTEWERLLFQFWIW